jgi:hypothetical protein
MSVYQPLWLSPDPFPPTPSNSSAMKNPENSEQDPDDSELADQGVTNMEYSFD